jgi:sortase A
MLWMIVAPMRRAISLAVGATVLAGLPLILSTGTVSARIKNDLVPQGHPTQVVIPRIGVRAALESNGLSRASDAHAPFKWEDAAWFSRGPRPGDVGKALVFGHLDSTCCPAIFWNLNSLRTGDRVQIVYPAGRTLTFQVVWSHVYWNKDVPTHWLYDRGQQRALVLDTCSGVFHAGDEGYDRKLFVFARLILPNGHLG